MRMVVAAARQEGIEPSLALAVADAESSFQPMALSHAGARGVMQMMPATARGEFNVPPAQLWNPAVNARLGSRFLRQLLDRYGRTDIALSHYNGGSAVRLKNGGLRVIPATRDYVRKVTALAGRYRNHPILSAGKLPSTAERLSRAAPQFNHTNPLSAERASLVRSLQKMRSGMASLDRAIFGGGADPQAAPTAAVSPEFASATTRRAQVARWESIYP